MDTASALAESFEPQGYDGWAMCVRSIENGCLVMCGHKACHPCSGHDLTVGPSYLSRNMRVMFDNGPYADIGKHLLRGIFSMLFVEFNDAINYLGLMG